MTKIVAGFKFQLFISYTYSTLTILSLRILSVYHKCNLPLIVIIDKSFYIHLPPPNRGHYHDVKENDNSHYNALKMVSPNLAKATIMADRVESV